MKKKFYQTTTFNIVVGLYQACASNPVFPQGGTWVYDRQGWCPVQSSLLKENNITSLVPTMRSLYPSFAGSDYRFKMIKSFQTRF